MNNQWPEVPRMTEFFEPNLLTKGVATNEHTVNEN